MICNIHLLNVIAERFVMARITVQHAGAELEHGSSYKLAGAAKRDKRADEGRLLK